VAVSSASAGWAVTPHRRYSAVAHEGKRDANRDRYTQRIALAKQPLLDVEEDTLCRMWEYSRREEEG
jgi:hypothetical protein